MTIAEISHRLNHLQFNSDVINLYDEPHRFYHTLDHIEDVLKQLHDTDLLKHDEVFIAAVFHDIVYNPQSKTNEEDSADFFLKEAKTSGLTEDQKKHIQQLILDTKNHKPTVNFSKNSLKLIFLFSMRRLKN